MTKIILIRHGHVEGIKPERFRGRAELALTARGIAQAKAVAKRIAMGWKPSVIYTSPMGRCVATAELIAQFCKVPVQQLIPSPIDQNPCAHWRNPMDMMRHG